jgi:hypothetical protein
VSSYEAKTFKLPVASQSSYNDLYAWVLVKPVAKPLILRTTFATHALRICRRGRAIPWPPVLTKRLARRMDRPPFPRQNSCGCAEKSSRDYIAEEVPASNKQ